MSGRLSNINVGTLKTTGPKQKLGDLSQIQISQQASTEAAFFSIPEVQIIRDIPGSEPYLIPELVPDLLYIYWYGGISQIIKSNNLSKPDQTQDQLIQFLAKNAFDSGFDGIETQLRELTNDSQVEIKSSAAGIEAVTKSIQEADPTNPSSIVFNHPTQQVHEDTQKIETELILNEPEVFERDDMQCVCGSRKIQGVIVQISSGDEAASFAAQCVTCNTKWIAKMA